MEKAPKAYLDKREQGPLILINNQIGEIIAKAYGKVNASGAHLVKKDGASLRINENFELGALVSKSEELFKPQVLASGTDTGMLLNLSGTHILLPAEFLKRSKF